MSEQPDLTTLSIKDLRQLAGEHQIQNRSRLGKDDLISALQGVLAGHLAKSSATSDGASAQPAKEVATKSKKSEEPTPAEPEVLDAAAVADLADDADDGDDEDSDEDQGEDDGAEGTGEPGERRRRRRRRRRRGRGRRDDAQSDAETAPLEADSPASDGTAGAEPVAPVTPTPPPAQSEVRAARPEAPSVSEVPRAPEPRPEVRAADPRPPRPRLDGPQRPLPSVLDRLCSFAKGILELCDPSTPSWAQARLSELLAEIGVVPSPATGLPHPEYHTVIGTIVAEGVPLGHIALVEAPGFAMRGDRGDLFSLRKAVVRVAGKERSDIAPVLAPTPSQRSQPTSRDSGDQKSSGAQASAPRRDRRSPETGREPLRTHGIEPAGEAPPLPLAQQEPEKLAARTKSTGFANLGLNDQILADLAAIGYNEPTPIQTESIPIALTSKDMLGQAQTGTGKTAAFVLPVLQQLYSIESPERKPVALMLCPTRELARQVYNEFNRMAGASGARAVVIYGGTPMDDQVRALERFPHVIIGTPGRIIDHMKRRTLDLSGLATIVLDEADQMLDIGFWPDVNYIMSHTPPARQVLLFSATFPEEVKELASQHMKDPVSVRIAPKQITVEQVDQKYIAVSRERKNALLAHFIESQNPPQLVVFCRTKHQTDRVAEVLKRKNMSAGAIHGDLPQSKRERILEGFRKGEIQSLIATNVAARGLDIPTVSHVVNYDIPEMPEEYVHRIGRTARNGALGVARTFITPEDGQFLLEIEKHIGLLLEEDKVEGFEATPSEPEVKRSIAEMPVGQPRILKPLVGGIRLGRRRR